MTICVAAIGVDDKNKEIIVFATDHMVSIGNLGQFEKTISKFKEINANTVAMLSGNPLIFDELLKDCCKSKDFDEIKEIIHKNMGQVKDAQIKSQILDIFKMDFEYIKEILKGEVRNEYMAHILRSLAEASLQTSILLIGFKEHQAQITEVREIGMQDYRDIDFGCIGSGSVQAMNTLLFQRHSKSDSLAVTLYNVYKAKRNAEVAVGVGEETDIVILTEKGITKIDGEKIEILRKVYEKELVLGKNHEKVKELVQSL
jgi:20S proteasome alpha/beta subunit